MHSMIYAVYRLLYGSDFICESVRSIDPVCEKIFIFWTNRALGNCTSCIYKRQTVLFPEKFDNAIEKVQALNNPKIVLVEDYMENNKGQFTHVVNDLILPAYTKPNCILFIEHDHVFAEEQLANALREFHGSGYVHASTRQIELWKTPFYCIPERKRLSCVLWNMKNIDTIPPTDRHANMFKGTPFLNNTRVHNFGFCMSNEAMYWKHMTALGFSQKIGDSSPDPLWLDKWLNWEYTDPEKNSALEISLGYQANIKRADKYDVKDLPRIIKEKYNIYY